jgi:hypothetical protein
VSSPAGVCLGPRGVMLPQGREERASGSGRGDSSDRREQQSRTLVATKSRRPRDRYRDDREIVLMPQKPAGARKRSRRLAHSSDVGGLIATAFRRTSERVNRRCEIRFSSDCSRRARAPAEGPDKVLQFADQDRLAGDEQPAAAPADETSLRSRFTQHGPAFSWASSQKRNARPPRTECQPASARNIRPPSVL